MLGEARAGCFPPGSAPDYGHIILTPNNLDLSTTLNLNFNFKNSILCLYREKFKTSNTFFLHEY